MPDLPASPASSDPAREWATRWLEDNGVALEMKVARQFLVGPSSVEHSGYYRDIDQQKLREFDVHATFSKGPSSARRGLTLEILVECKATSAPWILFMSLDSLGASDWDFESFFDSHSPDGATVRDLPGFPQAPAFRTAGRPHAYQVAEAAKKNEAAYAAVRQVLDAVAGFREEHARAAAPSGLVSGLRLYLPVVVTTAPLFEARLTPTGQVELQETDLAPLITRHDRADAGAVQRLVWIARESAVDQVVRKVLDSLDRMAT